MKKCMRMVSFGFLSWLVIFMASVCLFSLKNDNARLFEMLMSFVLTGCTVGCTTLYFRKIRAAFVREGALLGLAFAGCNIAFDLPMFLAGPMQMPVTRYLQEIGLAYLSMPIISLGVGLALKTQQRDSRQLSGMS